MLYASALCGPSTRGACSWAWRAEPAASAAATRIGRRRICLLGASFSPDCNADRYDAGMEKGRVEAFSDGMIGIFITIMVLELKVPHGHGWEAVRPLLPNFSTYVLSFVLLGIYWNNHHHMLQVADRINGKVLWANLHLLF